MFRHLITKRSGTLLPLLKGDTVVAGDTLGTVQETHAVLHRILVPNKTGGVVESISEGDFTIDETVAVLKTDKGNIEINMCTKWPVRVGRPYKRKLSPDILLTTGQRPIDTLFPLAKGGVAAVPGPFRFGQNCCFSISLQSGRLPILSYISVAVSVATR